MIKYLSIYLLKEEVGIMHYIQIDLDAYVGLYHLSVQKKEDICRIAEGFIKEGIARELPDPKSNFYLQDSEYAIQNIKG